MVTESGTYQIGQRFGPFSLEGFLGSGAFKTVYKARSDTGEPAKRVALAFPHRQDEHGLAELAVEFRAAARLEHPNILRLYRMDNVHGIGFLVMEYSEGGSLLDKLKSEGRLPERQVMRYMGLLAEALTYAHAAKVLHRDIKPANVMLSANDQPKLMDFGIARILAQTGELASTRIGTVSYMAPEQLNGAAGPNADLWALGVTGYELLTGRKPFETIQQIFNDPVPLEPLKSLRIDERLIRILQRLLEKEPADRYPNANELARDLETVSRRARLVDSDESRLELLIRASFPLIYLVSFEEGRVLETLRGIAQNLGREGNPRPVYVWSASRGLVDGKGEPVTPAANKEPTPALLHALQNPGAGIYVFLDLHPHFTPVNNRLLRDVARMVRRSDKSLILIAPFYQVPGELEKEVTLLGFQLPDKARLLPLLQQVMDETAAIGLPTDMDTSNQNALVKAASGLTLDEAERVFRRAALETGGFSKASVHSVVQEKRQIIRKSGILEYYPKPESFGSVGGLNLLLEWFRLRYPVFAATARYAGPPLPKGVLLVGVPGCGKSLCARALAGSWGVPLLRLDMGRVYAGVVGASEANLRRAIATAEAVSPCVLWLDEMDKGLTGSHSDSGGGVAARVFGGLLNWLQEKQSPVFVAATANNISAMPPELLRKGRFDEIFFVNLPNEEERQEIFAIQLHQCGRDPEQFDIAALASQAKGFSGAEIREVVVAGMFRAFTERTRKPGRDLQDDDLFACIKETQPLSSSLERELGELNAWARVHARPASGRPGVCSPD